MHKHNQQNNEKQHRRELRDWYSTNLGSSVLASIKSHIDTVTPNIYGYQALQLGQIAPAVDLLEKSELLRKQSLDFDSDTNNIHIQANPCELPIASDHVNLLTMMHILEFASDPHQALREVDRVLTADGHLIIIGFTPHGLWGLSKTVRYWKKETPWNGKFYSHWRITDWLRLLNFHICECRAFYLRPPLQSAAIRDKLHFIEKGEKFLPLLGNIHMIVARKKTYPLKPIRPYWRSRAKVIKKQIPETARTLNHREQSKKNNH